MATPTINILEAVNLFIGDHDPTASNHLELESVSLPTLERPTMNYTSGGSVGGVDWALDALNPFTIGYKLKGLNPDRLKLFGFGGFQRLVHTMYGVVRDKHTNNKVEAKAIVEAAIVKVAPSTAARASGMDFDYEAREVVRYGLWISGNRVHDVNWFTNELWFGDTNIFAQNNAILRIPGSS